MTEPLRNNFCYQLSPEEYWGLLTTISLNRVQELQDMLCSFPLSPNACIVTVGSDGKKERHPQSKTELVIWQSSPDHKPSDLPSWYQQTTDTQYSNPFETVNGSHCETKTLNSSHPVSYVCGDPNLVYPDRIVNALYVLGNPETYELARIQALSEMVDSGTTGKRVRKHLEQQRGLYNRTLFRGIYRGEQLFSVDPPVQIYDEKNMIFGFKIPVLRLLQRSLDMLTVKAIRSNLLTTEAAASGLPTPTVEKLEFFMRLGIVRDDPEVSQAYLWFLQEYHCAQELYQRTGKRVALEFDPETYFRNIRSLVYFMGKK